MDDNSLAHARWKCQYHIVFIPKYRKKVLYGQLRNDVCEVIRTLCNYKKVEIIEGAVCIDHMYLCLSIPPKICISEFMGYLKGKSRLMIYNRHLELDTLRRKNWAVKTSMLAGTVKAVSRADLPRVNERVPQPL